LPVSYRGASIYSFKFFIKKEALLQKKTEVRSMLIINVKDGESIDRALKRYKRKHRNVGVIKQLRKRKEFTKPSVQRRNEILKARYRKEKDQETGM